MRFAAENGKTNGRTFVQAGKENGSFTVEAAIVMPVVILSIAAVIYMGLLLCLRAQMLAAAQTAACDGAEAWSSGVADITTGGISKEAFNKIKLYRRIYDAGAQKRLEAIEEYAALLAGRRQPVTAAYTEIHAEIKDYIVLRKLEVTITKSYPLPLGSFMKIFGGSGQVNIIAKGSSLLKEPAELIRTADFIIDMEKKLEKSNPEIKSFGDKARNAMNEIKGRIEKLFE